MRCCSNQPVEPMRPLRLAPIVLVLLLTGSRAVAQTPAALEGLVVEAGTGVPLAGASVVVQGTVLGASTGPDGRFVLPGLRPGAYTVAASLLGYRTARLEVSLGDGPAPLRFELAEAPLTLEGVLAVADRPYAAASSTALRAFDLATRPVTSAQELLRLVPGLVIAQHAGGGKAEQIFLRGFDADHGTDVALSVDGLPVNMVSHGHGQGYADLHFVIPETVEEMDVRKGPYAAAFGNLATAGAVAFRTRDHLAHNLVRLEGGSFDTRRLTTLYRIPTPGAHQGAYLAGQFLSTDGPFESPQGFHRLNLFGKFHTHVSPSADLAVAVSGFSSAWDASGQVPARAVATGRIGRFGAIDDREGGTTGRQDLNVTYDARGPGADGLHLQSYLSRYHFKLFSNFTYFLDDPDRGDMIEQVDDRTLFGFNGRYDRRHPLGAGVATATFGGGFRADDVDLALWKSPDRVRAARRSDARIRERNLYLWAQEELVPGPRVRLQLGLRGDYFTFDVEDRLDGTDGGLPHASGYAQQMLLSPKASLVVSPHRAVDLFANAGAGFHSNDARDVVLGARTEALARDLARKGLGEAEIAAELSARGYDPAGRGAPTLPRAVGAELGLRATPTAHLLVSAAAWGLDLEREFVFVGDGGFTELSGATRRYGLDLEARLQAAPWLWLDGEFNVSRGFFKDAPAGEDRIPLAPRVTATGGVTVRHPSGLDGSLRLRHVGDRPANEGATVTAKGYTLVDLYAARRLGAFTLSATLENLFDAAWNEAQFDTASRLPGEAAAVSELHFTPGPPRALRLGLGYAF